MPNIISRSEHLIYSSLETPADTSCTVGVPTKLFTYINNKKGSVMRFGGGYLYIKIIDDGAGVETGKVKFYLADANELKQELVFECNSLVSDASKTDKTKMQFVPVQHGVKIGYKGKLLIQFESDATDIIDVSACELQIPVTFEYQIA